LHKVNGINVIHQFLSNKIFYLVLAFLCRDVQCGVHVLGDSIDLGSMLEKQHDDVDIAQTRSNVQWSLLLASTGIDLGTIA
jgi:hypothetical protein